MLRSSVRRLEVFVAAAEAGSFVAAAERLGIEQPSVSQHVRALEAELGQALFERRRGRPAARLTEAGQALLARAGDLLRDARMLTEEADRQRRAAEGRVVLSCQRLVANFVLPVPLAEFARLRAGTQLTIRTANQAEVYDDLLSGAADLGCFLSNEPPAGLPSEKIGEERLALVAAPGHPLAALSRTRRVAPAEVAAHAFVRGPTSSLLGQELDRMLAGIGVARTPVASRTTEYNMGRELVAAGIGVLFTLRKGVRADLERGALEEIRLDAPELKIDLRQAFSPRRAPSAAALLLADHLRAGGLNQHPPG